MGGTFDLLHKGHRALLETAFKYGNHVLIGLSDSAFVRRLHKPHRVDDYDQRKRELEDYLRQNGLINRAEIVPLPDKYGPTVNDPTIEAIVVSRRTVKTVGRINAIRRRKGMKPLYVIPIDLILAEDRRPISTTRIRRDRIDREGRVLYVRAVSKKSK
jgi:pantetheine-phosphate adenylyltransferase